MVDAYLSGRVSVQASRTILWCSDDQHQQNVSGHPHEGFKPLLGQRISDNGNDFKAGNLAE